MGNSNPFSVNISSYKFIFQLKNGILSIKGCSSGFFGNQDYVYDANYEDNSIPEDISKKFNTLENLCTALYEYRSSLKLQKDDLLLEIDSNIFKLPLKLYFQKEKLQNYSAKTNYSHPIEILQDPYSFPYNAVVRIQATNQHKTITLSGSGFFIKKNTVMTVAHNVYQRDKFEAKQIFIYVKTKNGQLRIKIEKHIFPNEYKTTNMTDMHKYDLAFLLLQANDAITDDQILQTKWNLEKGQTKFEVVGYSPELDKKNSVTNNCYHLRCNRFIQLLQNYGIYAEKAASGISGGPLIIQQSGKFYVIGLHQCLKSNMSQAVILTQFGKSAKQIYDGLNKQKQIHEYKSPQTKADQLFENAQKQLKINSFEKASTLFKECLQITRQYLNCNSFEYAEKLLKIGEINFQYSNYDYALICCKQSLQIKQKIILDKKHDKRYTKAIIAVAGIYDKKNQLKQALKQYNKARQIFESLDENNLKERVYDYGKTLINIGAICSKNGDDGQALKHYKIAEQKYKNTEYSSRSRYTILLSNIANIYQNQKEYFFAFGYYSGCLEVMKNTNQNTKNSKKFEQCKKNVQEVRKKLLNNQ